jgi:hypothetical protein
MSGMTDAVSSVADPVEILRPQMVDGVY